MGGRCARCRRWWPPDRVPRGPRVARGRERCPARARGALPGRPLGARLLGDRRQALPLVAAVLGVAGGGRRDHRLARWSGCRLRWPEQPVPVLPDEALSALPATCKGIDVQGAAGQRPSGGARPQPPSGRTTRNSLRVSLRGRYVGGRRCEVPREWRDCFRSVPGHVGSRRGMARGRAGERRLDDDLLDPSPAGSHHASRMRSGKLRGLAAPRVP